MGKSKGGLGERPSSQKSTMTQSPFSFRHCVIVYQVEQAYAAILCAPS